MIFDDDSFGWEGEGVEGESFALIARIDFSEGRARAARESIRNDWSGLFIIDNKRVLGECVIYVSLVFKRFVLREY